MMSSKNILTHRCYEKCLISCQATYSLFMLSHRCQVRPTTDSPKGAAGLSTDARFSVVDLQVFICIPFRVFPGVPTEITRMFFLKVIQLIGLIQFEVFIFNGSNSLV